MESRLIKRITFITIAIISLLFIYNNLFYIYDRIRVMVVSGKYTCFYNVISLDDKYNAIVEAVQYWFQHMFQEIKVFIIWLYRVLISPDALIIYCWILQVIMFIYVFFTIWVSGSSLDFKTTKMAKFTNKLLSNFRRFINYCYDFYQVNKSKVHMIIIWCSGLGFILAFEIIVFVLYYIYCIFTLETYLIIFGVFKWVVVNVVDFFMFEHPAKIIVVCFICYVVLAIYLGKRKLQSNWIQFKYGVVGQAQPLNILSGAPGTGKTSTAFNAVLAQTELYYDKYVDCILDYEINHPEFNGFYARFICKMYYEGITEEELEKALKYDSMFLVDLLRFSYIVDEPISEALFKMYYRGSSIVSASPLKDPYSKNTNTNGYARKLDFTTMRLFKKSKSLPFENDTTLFIDEFDKEFNSHTSQKEVNNDGVHGFFSYIRHLLGSDSTSWMTCQGLGQGLMNIKVCAGKLIWLSNKKTKMPVLVKTLYGPIAWIDSKLSKVLLEYLGYRQKTGKFSARSGTFKFKRNNVSTLFILMKYLCMFTHSIVNYLSNFMYYKITAEVSYDTENKHVEKIVYKINYCDYYDDNEPIYNSEQFGSFYADFKMQLEKEIKQKQSVQLFEAWSSLEPTMEEYNKTNQRFIKKIYDSQFSEEE